MYNRVTKIRSKASERRAPDNPKYASSDLDTTDSISNRPYIKLTKMADGSLRPH